MSRLALFLFVGVTVLGCQTDEIPVHDPVAEQAGLLAQGEWVVSETGVIYCNSPLHAFDDLTVQFFVTAEDSSGGTYRCKGLSDDSIESIWQSEGSWSFDELGDDSKDLNALILDQNQEKFVSITVAGSPFYAMRVETTYPERPGDSSVCQSFFTFPMWVFNFQLQPSSD